MKIDVRALGEVTIVELSGPAEVGAPARLGQAVRERLETGARHFVLHATGVDYLDSATIGETMACFKRVRAAGGDLKIVAEAGGRVEQILRITALDRLVELHPDEDAAITSFAG